MGYLADEELASLRVERMIIHLVGKPGEPFTPRDEIDVQEEGFFRARIQSEAGDGVHSFVVGSEVRHQLELIAKGEVTFPQGGQVLARRFFDMHVKQSVAGAFFLLQLRTAAPDSVLFALIKYDYREAVELTDAGGRSVLRAIVQAFVKDRHAVQKFCLVRVIDGAAQELVCASDRMKEAPDLTDYFERYLGVRRSKSNAELSKRLNEALRGTLQDVKDILPNSDVGAAVSKAKLALQGRATVSNDDIVDAVLHAADRPDDEDLRYRIDVVTRRRLKRLQLQDIEFRPDRDTLQVQPRRIVRTAEEVRLEFPGEELGRSVTRETFDDEVVFTVRTRRLVEDGTLPVKTR
ncbi:nucleoid-associated protein [Mesorhizobium sp. B1-1-7]|uniref:nucleoid-associated protein n=1 Tax=Mesorhizobium sp. B1-1-7 TaxID=2589977 RepID=UPI001128C162|nr:nucleoid-associated protein [Mesorhizobium sp. B1-1-7]TPN42810.1 nucleoid-associated protein [Mesorhizobium sp. B1-1-7]